MTRHAVTLNLTRVQLRVIARTARIPEVFQVLFQSGRDPLDQVYYSVLWDFDQQRIANSSDAHATVTFQLGAWRSARDESEITCVLRGPGLEISRAWTWSGPDSLASDMRRAMRPTIGETDPSRTFPLSVIHYDPEKVPA